MGSLWRIELFGGLRVAREQIVVAGFCNQKAAALLAYLTYYLRRNHDREMLADLLWPECDPQVGRHRLSNVLSWLRRAPDVADLSLSVVLKGDRATIQLDPALVTSDVVEFEAALEAAARSRVPGDRTQYLTHAVRNYVGELLPGDQNDWIVGERERLSERFFQALAQLIHYREQLDDPEGALEYVHQGLRLDPLREEIHRDAMRLYAALGRPDAARRQYAEIERLLRNELGTPPSAATHALLASIDREDSWAPLSLPAALTRFFGREDEIRRLSELLGSSTPQRRGQGGGHRLVTLTGPGGSGKTRLALETARRMASAWRGGVGLVTLADIANPRSILEAIRGALQVPPVPSVDVLDQVVTALRRRPTLLLLDTFEHLVEKGAPLVRSLLERVPSLTCLVTSRRPLAIEGEWEFPVLPLPVPAEGSDPLSYSSVQLFVDRAQAVCPDFRVTPENAEVAAGICRRLEGIPLALELAAVWIRMLTPAQIMSRLDHRFDFLVSRRHDVCSRHRTLRSAIDWSYRLLGSGDPDGTAPLQRVFTRLAVFQAGCDLEGAAVVCAQPGWGTQELLDALTTLSEQSLMQRQQSEGSEARYHMLETIREYAGERLLACGEEPEVRRRHALHFVSLAEQLEFDDFHEREEWLTRLQREHENLRSALAWSLDQDGELALRLAGSLHLFWLFRGNWAEGRDWLEQALARHGTRAPAPVRAKALHTAGCLAHFLRDIPASRKLQSEAAAIWHELGDQRKLTQSLTNLGWSALYAGEFETARTLLRESEMVARAIDYQWILVSSLNGQAQVVLTEGQAGAALQLSRAAAEIAREVGDPLILCWALGGMGRVVLALEDHLAAEAVYQELLDVSRRLGYQTLIAEALGYRGHVAQCRGDLNRARSLYEEWLEIERGLAKETGVVAALLRLGQVCQAMGDAARAHQYFRESQAIRGNTHDHRSFPEYLDGLVADAGKGGEASDASTATAPDR